jgi:hypothetical protein
MPRGSKAKYTSKQKRQAEHIEEGYEKKGDTKKTAKKKAWATVNKVNGGGKKGGSGTGKKAKKAPLKKVGKKGGTAKKKAAKKSPGRPKKAATKRGRGRPKKS